MSALDYTNIEFKRLPDVDPAVLMDLMNDPDVRRHLPLAKGHFGSSDCEKFVSAKERIWKDRGYGPWAFMSGDEFIGWGGLQPEGEDVDIGLVLHRKYWGAGRVLYRRIVDYAFRELQAPSVIVLLPPSRARVAGIFRLGFREDDEVMIDEERFVRYRLMSDRSTMGGERVARR